MFRAQQNAFDEAVAKATDENLTSENWEYIMDVCDRATSNESGPKDVVAALIKRLAHRNANVQLYTLELANALSQNGGTNVHTELASRSFTDALLRLANDRNTHNQVKAKILERMHDWTDMFANDRNLGIMEQAYMRLKTQNPNLAPPSKPVKQQITDADRQKEEDELQMALELSVKDRPKDRPGPTSAGDQGQRQDAGEGPSQQAAGQAVPAGTTAATVSRVRALFDFQPSEPGELQFKKGDIIAVLESVYKDWWKGSLRGHTGIFPLNYVEKLADPTPEELQREGQMEAEVFSEIKNVEKLLTLLSTSNSEMNVRDNEEITTLYHSTLAIRPKLIELIGKYSQRKDDFTQLNEKFIKARRDYEALLEASMSQPPPQHGYGRPATGYSYPPVGYPPQGPPAGQHDPGRYYSPNPQDSRTPMPQLPNQNGPQPFYLAGQAPGAPPQGHAPFPPTGERTDSPAALPQGQRPGEPYGAPPGPRPPSTYDYPGQNPGQGQPPPHELGTAEARRQSYPAHMQPPSGPEYSPSVYSPEDPYAQQQQQQQPQSQNPYPAPLSIKPPHQQPYPGSEQATPQQAQPPYGQHVPQSPPYGGPPPQQQQQQQQQPYSQQPGQPNYPPPGVPSSPGAPANPYPNLNAQPPAAYQAYQPPRQGSEPQGGGYGGNPQDYYR